MQARRPGRPAQGPGGWIRQASAQSLGQRTSNPLEQVWDEGIAVLLRHTSGTILGAVV